MSIKFSGAFSPFPQTTQIKLRNTVPAIPSTYGGQYVSSYLTTTGGTLYYASPGDNIESLVDSTTDGDAILFNPGTYTMNPKNLDSFQSLLNRGKNICFAGNTDIPGEVVIEADHDVEAAVRDHPLLSQTTNQTHWAFLSIKRIQVSATNYSNSIVRGYPNKGRLVNCYLDFNNGPFSWIYDNAGATLVNLNAQFRNCTFANMSGISTKYAGSNTATRLYNCLVTPVTNYQSTQCYNENTVFGATVDINNRTYDTGTYATAGHLYVPTLTAEFTP